MRALVSNHRTRRVAALAVSLAGAVTFASPARADDGTSLSELVSTATAAASVTVVAPEHDAAAEAPIEELAPLLEVPAHAAGPEAQVEIGEQPAADVPDAGDTASPAVDTTADTATEHVPMPAATPDAAPPTRPHAAAPAPTPAPIVRPGAGASQAAPANVNVSVRIDSPGDVGPVTQSNVAVVAGLESATPASAQPEPSAADASAGATGSCTVPSSILDVISATNESKITIPVLEKIYGNCAPADAQGDWYQPVISPQYRPVNVNVSIRIRSPGNDGGVTQTNVALAISGLVVPGLAGASAAPTTTPSVVAIVRLDETAVALPEAAASDATALLEEPRDPESAPVSVVVLAPDSGRRGLGAPRGILPGGATAGPPTSATDGRFSRPFDSSQIPAGTDSSQIAAGTESHPSASRRTTEPRPARPRLEPAPPVVPLDAAPAGPSAAAASGGGSPGGELPVYLLSLPFIAAVLGLAWRVALAQATPSGYRARMLDDPG